MDAVIGESWLRKSLIAAAAVASVVTAYFYVKGKAKPRAVRMTGRTAIVTGGTHGLGKVACERLVRKGLKVILACRDLTKGEVVVRELQKLAPPEHTEPVAECIHCDLASLVSVRKFAEEYLSRIKSREQTSLQVLLLNAGMFPKTNQSAPTYTTDGFEECFATNHLGHFLLTKLLLPHLKASLKLDSLDTLRADWKARCNGVLLYKNSKLANVLFANELNRRLSGEGVTANSLSPGFIPNTGLSRNQGMLAGVFMKYIMPYLPFKFISTVEHGADCVEYVAFSPELEGKGGKYFALCREAVPSDAARDPALAARLWELSEEAVAPFVTAA